MANTFNIINLGDHHKGSEESRRMTLLPLKALLSCTLLLPRVYRVLTATQHPQPLSHLKAFILPDPPQGSEFPLALMCLVSARKQFKSILAKYFYRVWGDNFPGGSDGKEFAWDAKFDPGSGRSPGEGKVNPFQYSCLENSMDRGAWWVYSPWVAKIRTRLSG